MLPKTAKDTKDSQRRLNFSWCCSTADLLYDCCLACIGLPNHEDTKLPKLYSSFLNLLSSELGFWGSRHCKIYCCRCEQFQLSCMCDCHLQLLLSLNSWPIDPLQTYIHWSSPHVGSIVSVSINVQQWLTLLYPSAESHSLLWMVLIVFCLFLFNCCWAFYQDPKYTLRFSLIHSQGVGDWM